MILFSQISEWIQKLSSWIYTVYTLEKGYVCLLLFLILGVYITCTLKKKHRDIRWTTFSLYFYHLLVITGIGWLLTLVSQQVTWVKAVIELTSVLGVLTYFLFVLFLKYRFMYWKSAGKVQVSFFRVLYFILLLTILPAMVAGKWGAIDRINMGLLLFLLFFVVYVPEKTTQSISNDEFEESDTEITERTQLFPSRLVELERIKRYMTQMYYSEPFAIAIHAAYGEGKSSLINVLMSELKSEGHKTVYLKPTITDTKDKLIEHFFKQLENVLRQNGVFTGKGSPFQKYLEQLGQLIDNKKMQIIAGVLGIFDNESTENFRDAKKRLEEDIQRMLHTTKGNSKRLYIVVDDFDRVEKQTVYETLIFIKELVDFKGCGVLFLFNYEKIVDQKIDQDYLDKFIGKRFDLEQLEYREILSYFIGKKKQLKLSSGSLIVLLEESELLASNIQTYLNEAETKLVSIIENKKQKKYMVRLNNNGGKSEEEVTRQETKLNEEIVLGEMELKQYIEKINNPRRLKRLLREIKETFNFFNDRYRNVDNPYLAENWKSAKLHRLIFNAALIKYVFEEQHAKLLKSGNIPDFLVNCESILIRDYLLLDVSKDVYRELEQSQQQMRIKLYEVIMFQRFGDELYVKKLQTETEQIVALLDNEDWDSIDESSLSLISNFIEATKRQRFDVDSQLTARRLQTIATLMFKMVDKGLLTIPDVIQWIDRKELSTEILVLEPSILHLLNQKLVNTSIEFINDNEKRTTLYRLQQMRDDLIPHFRADVQLAGHLYLSSTPKNVISRMNNVDSLSQLNATIKEQLPSFVISEQETVLSELEQFKRNLEYMINHAENDTESDIRRLRVIQYCRERFYIFINLYGLYENIISFCNNAGLLNPYESDPVVGSIREAEESIHLLYSRVVIGNLDGDNSNVYQRVHQLLSQLRKIKEAEKINKDVANLINAVYEKLNEHYTPKLYDERGWLWCGLVVSEILNEVEGEK